MKIVFFVHSFASDWNHGNAHFLRGLMSALAGMGHQVTSYEPHGAWSVENLVRDHGVVPILDVARAYPEIDIRGYDPRFPTLTEQIQAAVAGADLVLVHEWNEPHVVNAIPALVHAAGGIALFHDTHHRPWSEPEVISRLDLRAYDGVLAFGDVLRDVYRRRFAVERAWTFHEAADVVRFKPLDRPKDVDVIWIGNWGDEERTEELRDYWLGAARRHPELRFAAHGVRYPEYALAELENAGVEFRGWAPSLTVPEAFARSRVTLHVPRRAYVEGLRGIPTIRVFEALACGIPLVSAPWLDSEHLFEPGDYVAVDTPEAMWQALHRLATDDDARAEQAERGLRSVLARHTCGHRALQLLEIVEELGAAGAAGGTAGNRGQVTGDSLQQPRRDSLSTEAACT